MVIAECFWLEKLEISFILSIDERGTYFYLIGQSHKKSHAITYQCSRLGLLPEFETIT